MGSSKLEIEKFDGHGDFNMWRKKMWAIMVQQKCAKALGGEKDLSVTMIPEENEEMKERAYNLLILNLSDNVFRKIWQTLFNKIYLKEQLFGFKMNPAKSLEENLDDFKVITVGLAKYRWKDFRLESSHYSLEFPARVSYGSKDCHKIWQRIPHPRRCPSSLKMILR